MQINRRFLVFLPFLAALTFGCSKGQGNLSQGVVSGKVTYNGAPVTGGTISFLNERGGATGVIRSDGTYRATEVPIGEVVVIVETESVKPKDAVEYKGGGGPKAGGGKSAPSGTKIEMSPRPSSASAVATTYVKIPAKYSDKTKTDLKMSVSTGSNSKDFELKD